MTNTLALINTQTNVCENVTLDERPASEVFVEGYLVLDLTEIGGGGIGWVWDGDKLVKNNPVPIPPEKITRRQCALELLARQIITAQEALDMTKTADVPAAIAAVFDAQVAGGAWTSEQRTLAEIDFAADNYYRSNSLLSLMGLTEQEIDQFFIAAAKL